MVRTSHVSTPLCSLRRLPLVAVIIRLQVVDETSDDRLQNIPTKVTCYKCCTQVTIDTENAESMMRLLLFLNLVLDRHLPREAHGYARDAEMHFVVPEPDSQCCLVAHMVGQQTRVALPHHSVGFKMRRAESEELLHRDYAWGQRRASTKVVKRLPAQHRMAGCYAPCAFAPALD